jgi:hypothetical protein
MSRYKASYQNDHHTVELELFGYSGDLNDISNLLKLKPTLILLKGEQRKPPRGPVAKENVWEYRIENSEKEEADDVLRRMLEILKPKLEDIQLLSKSCKVRIGVGSTTYHYNPEIFLQPEDIKLLSDLRAVLWFDIYSFTEDYLEEASQQQHLKHMLSTSESAHKLGINNDTERNAIIEVLTMYESFSKVVPKDLFPDYAEENPATEDDIHEGLLRIRRRLYKLHAAIEKSEFFMAGPSAGEPTKLDILEDS